uniref:Protein kinase domain-containing protein n=1 Tax=Anopheles culicifacies TaxID=139723 RepID=A0A182M5B9_9DIPT
MAYNGLSQHVDFSRLPSPNERFELLDLIGEGTYGEVYSAKDKHTGRKYAVKLNTHIYAPRRMFKRFKPGARCFGCCCCRYMLPTALIGCNTSEVFDGRVGLDILESIADNIEEIEEEYLVLRDLSKHPNIPDFAGLFLKRGTTVEDDQLWFVLEVSGQDANAYVPDHKFRLGSGVAVASNAQRRGG